jgi:hypothetical protein|tara:strand:+ start:314 stop:565 length:252 start_codon:yes stop_codon:yes gene_type:complete
MDFPTEKIEISHSIDGRNFNSLFEEYPNNKFSLIQDIFKYEVKLENLETRYIRVNGENIKNCPEYHPGVGAPCWIFTDEIVVN